MTIGDRISISIPSAWPFWPRTEAALPSADTPVHLPFDWQRTAQLGTAGHYRLLTAHDGVRLNGSTQGAELRWEAAGPFGAAQLHAAAAGEAAALQALKRHAQREVEQLAGFAVLKDVQLVDVGVRRHGSFVCLHLVTRYTLVRDSVPSETRNLRCPDGEREIQLTAWAAPIDAASAAVLDRIVGSLRITAAAELPPASASSPPVPR